MNPVGFLRRIALLEGVSFLLLLCLAMPLKYIWGQPGAVRIVGMAHGALWLLFCIALLYTTIVAKWPLGRAALIFVAALLPFGPWFVDGRLQNFERDFLNKGGTQNQTGPKAK